MAGPNLPTNISAGASGHVGHSNAVHDIVNRFDKDATPTDGQAWLWSAVDSLYKPGDVTSSGGGLDVEAMRDAVAAFLVASGLVTIVHDDPGNTLTIGVSSEAIQDMMAGFLLAGSGGALTYDDASNTLTVGAGAGVPEELYYNGTSIVNMTGTTISSRPTTRPIHLTGGSESIRPVWMNQPADKHFVTVVA